MFSPPHFRAKKYKQDKHNLTYEEFLFIMRKLPVQVNNTPCTVSRFCVLEMMVGDKDDIVFLLLTFNFFLSRCMNS